MTSERFVDDAKRLEVLAAVAEDFLGSTHPCTQDLRRAKGLGKSEEVDTADRALRDLPSAHRQRLLMEAKRRTADDERVGSFIHSRKPRIFH